MDMGIVAAYTGFWKWQIKRHLKPPILKNYQKKNYNVTQKHLMLVWRNLKI